MTDIEIKIRSLEKRFEKIDDEKEKEIIIELIDKLEILGGDHL